MVALEHSEHGSSSGESVLRTVQEVAARLAVSTPAAYELIRSGRLPAVRLGRRIRVDSDVLDRWIAHGGYGPTP